MKITFPIAEDYLHREDLFFEQFELALYHAKKSWAKIRNQERYKGDPDNDYPWIKFRFSDDIQALIDEKDPDYESREISLIIEEL